MAPMRNRSHLTVWSGAIVTLLMLQQAPFVIRGDYSRRVVWQATSPDQRHRLEIRRQSTFPAWRDPSGMAYFAIVDTRTGRLGARTIVPLQRVSDLKRPTVQWSAEDVQVADFEQTQPAAVRLLLAR